MSVFLAYDNIYGIDLYEERRPGRSSAYFVPGAEPILVETGSSASHDALVSGLDELGAKPEELRHIVVTHVHLDHSGGVGQMMAAAPDAILHCHSRAAQHLIDPSRLAAGAQAVYGDLMESLFGPLVPVPPDRVTVQEDESVLETPDRTLVFYDTPGHAKHHTCALDERTGGLFSGDTVGIRYTPAYTHWGFVYGFPTTSPSDFDPDVMLATLDRLESLGIARIYHTHYGVTDPAAQAFEFSRRGVLAIKELCGSLSESAAPAEVERALSAIVANDLASIGHPGLSTAPVAMDLGLNSQGILVYLQKRARGKL